MQCNATDDPVPIYVCHLYSHAGIVGVLLVVLLIVIVVIIIAVAVGITKKKKVGAAKEKEAFGL